MQATGKRYREGLAVKQDLVQDKSCWLRQQLGAVEEHRGHGELQRESSHQEVAREDSCRIHLSVMLLQNFTSVAARKAPLLVYPFGKWIKRHCRTVRRFQRAGS